MYVPDLCGVYYLEIKYRNEDKRERLYGNFTESTEDKNTQNIENINSKKYEYQSGTHFMDIISECEKLGDYVINVIEAVKEKRGIKN